MDSEVGNPSPPEPEIGSGKFGTPCERKHSAIASWELDPALGFELEPPHAASAAAQAAALTSRIARVVTV
jgi:hypothetical protein